jgi:hypothetical protein
MSKLTGKSVRIDSTRCLAFEPFESQIGAVMLAVRPFLWDATNFCIADTGFFDVEVLRTWFYSCFDPEDQNPADALGLYRVVHFMGDIERSGHELRFQIDFGSATTHAFGELIAAIEGSGVRSVSVR